MQIVFDFLNDGHSTLFSHPIKSNENGFFSSISINYKHVYWEMCREVEHVQPNENENTIIRSANEEEDENNALNVVIVQATQIGDWNNNKCYSRIYCIF